MTILVAATAGAGIGKDSLANVLIEHFGFVGVRFAGGIYDQVAKSYGVTKEFLGIRETKETDTPLLALNRCSDAEFVAVALRHSLVNEGITNPSAEVMQEHLNRPRSPRRTMQWWGTEYRRDSTGNQDYWVNDLDAQLEATKPERAVVTDLREENEAAYLRSRNAEIIHIKSTTRFYKVSSHSSENGIKFKFGDSLIMNNGTLAEFGVIVSNLAKELQLDQPEHLRQVSTSIPILHSKRKMELEEAEALSEQAALQRRRRP